MPRAGYVVLEGSRREPVAGARALAPANADEHVDVTVVLRPRRPLRPGDRLSRAELAEARGAEPAAVERIERFAAEHGLQVLASEPGRRRVVLSGTVADLQRAFDVTLARFEHRGGGTYRGRTGPVHVPEDMADDVVAVLGLDERAQAQAHLRIRAPGAAAQSYTPLDLARLYDFPTGADGTGECIGIVELGGGFRQADLTAYFDGLGVPAPRVVAVSVDGGRNQPSDSSSADGEVMLDIEAAGAVAPGARIAVYFAPNTDRGFLDAVTEAVHDATNRPSVLSISWGGPESSWTAQAMTAMDQAFADAGAAGVTVFCAAGDNGSSDGVDDGRSHADFPASSPNVVACGGTRLEATGGAIASEVVWSADGATGGGVSDQFGVPGYQRDAGVPPSANPGGHRGRGLPDVAADADPDTGYEVRVDGQALVIGGTSAVAPLLAGLTALLNQQLGAPVGFLNPRLYAIGAAGGAFRDVTQGSNGAYRAAAGWDACTGWGSPRGTALLAALRRGQTP